MMAKNYNISGSNIKIPNEGKNLINNNAQENVDTSNNYNSIQKNLFLGSNKSQNKFMKETNLTMQPRIKNKNEIMSKEKLNQDNDIDININENMDNNKPKKKENKLTSSIFFYKESKIFTIFRRLYKKWQLYIAIFLSVISTILFIISIFDLFNKMKKKDNYYLCKSYIYYGEIISSILIIVFYIIYYSFNTSHNNLIYIILCVLIFLFSAIYTHTYIKQKVDIIKVLFHTAYNFSLFLINLIYLFMSYFINRKKFKEQQNIEDIMNFTIRNEKIEDNLADRKKDRKNKGIELVEEEIQNNGNGS